MNPDKHDLLELIVNPGRDPVDVPTVPLSAQSKAARAHLHARAGKHPQFAEWLGELERHLPPPSDPELDGYFHYALMGITVGFADRNLSPYLDVHVALIATVLDDVRSVYEQIRAGGSTYSPDEFVFRAFDYGIHKAYYLDWQLYLSKELY